MQLDEIWCNLMQWDFMLTDGWFINQISVPRAFESVEVSYAYFTWEVVVVFVWVTVVLPEWMIIIVVFTCVVAIIMFDVWLMSL